VKDNVVIDRVKAEGANDLRGAVRFPLHLHVDLHEKAEGQSAETMDISAGWTTR
jgi:hypothetical protein